MARGKLGGGGRRWGKGGWVETERDFVLGDGHTMQGADDIVLGCTLEACMVWGTNVTPINSIERRKMHIKQKYFTGVYSINFSF